MATVGTVSVDFKAGIAQLVTGVDQVNTKLGNFGKTLERLKQTGESVERSLSFLLKFGAGGAVAGGIAGLVTHMAHLAETLKDTNPEAEEFVKQLDRLRDLTSRGFLVAMGAMSPLLEAIANGAEAAAAGWHKLNDEVQTYMDKKAEEALALSGGAPSRVQVPQAGFIQGIGRLGPPAPMQFPPNFAQTMNEGMLTQLSSLNDETNIQATLDRMGNFQNKIREINLKEKAETDKKLEALNAEHLRISLAQEEDALKESSDAREELAKQDAALTKALGDESVNNLKRMNELTKEFGDLFAENLVQAMDGGFKAVLKSWLLTLEQMVLKAEAMNLARAFLGTSVGKGVAGLLGGLLGGATGATGSIWGDAASAANVSASGSDFIVGGTGGPDTKLLRLGVSPGERVTVRPPALSNMVEQTNGVMVVNHNTFNGNMDRGDLLRLLEANRQQTLADVRSQNQRRW